MHLLIIPVEEIEMIGDEVKKSIILNNINANESSNKFKPITRS